MKALFLGLSPQSQNAISLPEELRRIKASTRAGTTKIDWFEEWGPTPDELVLLMARHRPDFIHIATHGVQHEGLLFRDSITLSLESMRIILRTPPNRIQCVLMNACHSDELARCAANIAECAIGFAGRLNDDVAIRFAEVFYGMMALGYSIAEAYVTSIGRIAATNTNRPRDISILGPSSIRASLLGYQIHTRVGSAPHRIRLDKDELDSSDTTNCVSLASVPEGHFAILRATPNGWLSVNPFAYLKVGQLLDMLYVRFLHDRFRPYSYGEQWVLEIGGEDLSEMDPLVREEYEFFRGPTPCIVPIEALLDSSFDRAAWYMNAMWHCLDVLPGTRFEIRPVGQLFGMVNGAASGPGLSKRLSVGNWRFEQTYVAGTYWDERVLNTKDDSLIDIIRSKLQESQSIPIMNVGRLLKRD